MCSRHFDLSVCLSMSRASRGSIETRSFPNSLVACPRYFTLITRTARACASYPSCVAVYTCDSDRDVFYVADPLSSIHHSERIKKFRSLAGAKLLETRVLA